MRTKILIPLGILVLVLSGCSLFSTEESATPNPSETLATSTETAPAPAATATAQSAKNVTTQKSVTVPTTQIVMSNFAYSPSTLTVKKGTKITWRNNDSVAHTVTSDQGEELSSALLGKGDEYNHVFNNVGTHTYHCAPHPKMRATVTVIE